MIHDADAVDSLAFTIFASMRKDMPHVRATIVATNFLFHETADSNMGLSTVGIVRHGVGVPTRIGKFGGRRVERMVACLARKVTILGKELAEFALAVGFRAALAEDVEFFFGQHFFAVLTFEK